MRLWHRLFLLCAGLSVASLLGYAAWQQRAFATGFATYLDSVAERRAAQLATRLAEEYRQRGSWDFLRRDPHLFGGLAMNPQAFSPAPDDGRGSPAPPGSDRRKDRGAAGNNAADRAGPARGGGPPGPPPGSINAGDRLVLLDENGQRLAGSRESGTHLVALPVLVDGRRVGELRVAPLPPLADAPERVFAESQWRSGLVAALAVLLCALALAYALAQRLLKPIQALSRSSRALADGDFSSRVPAQGRDEIAALARDFNHLAAALEQNREARRRWGADLAHELRTPVTVLRLELQTLIDGVRQPGPAAMASLLAETERLSALIEDLYQLSLADAGALEYHFETVDLAELAREVVDNHRGSAAAAGQLLEEDYATDLPPLRGDPLRLAQLIENLLLNARRYTDAPGRIRIALAVRAGQLQLQLEDTPPGVAAEDLPRLFDRLFRSERSRNRSAGGAGLGLSICRAIVDAHSGAIWAEASDLGGLRVCVLLPLPGERA
ncbi:two-component system sensor histidine kinase BaeS [Tahibacter aquaticus]|uniref:histidine kinase n=2 Tax=Tahibacter aquaticus TaxID=520092 RepID=A0A4R6YSW2_9GAMM|nr:two-component system sensor histidine kinase BaeS [Tahibacter aquaticus]